MHELSELLFKVTSGKINDEAEEQAAFFCFDERNGMPDWDEPFFTGGRAAAQMVNEEKEDDYESNDENL